MVYLSLNEAMKGTDKIEIIPIRIKEDIVSGQNISDMIVKSISQVNESLKNNDVLVVTHKIISKAEDRLVSLAEIDPSFKAKRIAKSQSKDPRLVELIMTEALELVKIHDGVIIAETKHGFVCANAGIDTSNVDWDGNKVALLPIDSDFSASKIRKDIWNKEKKDVAVVISDTFGRPFREGQINVAIGVSGLNPIKSYVGKRDMYGKPLRVTEIAIADEIASAAELVMKKSARIPVVILRGLRYSSKQTDISRLIRPKENDFFR
jgi:coenzyme F420-0:L-glutamate ligase / coenzyme F420-1:gamma-L-glutamate ligase